jgi:cytosine/adenosine deaminase-related metal-dependent hydrolase
MPPPPRRCQPDTARRAAKSRSRSARPERSPSEAIDARGRLVIPDLVDTHRHVWQGAIGGFTPQVTGAGCDPAVLHGIAPRNP